MWTEENAMKNFLLAGAALSLIAACSQAAVPEKPEAPATEVVESAPELSLLQVAVNDSSRSDEEKARDVWRHPVETLEFFGVEPSDTVIEIWPGGGWYTNILAPYLAAGG